VTALFACVVARSGERWTATEVDVDGCESIIDLGDVARDVEGELRLLLLEQDDEYAVIIRVDEADDEPRAFLSDGHAADFYPVAAYIAEDLDEIGGAPDDDEVLEDAPPAHDSAPFGDAEIVEDLGTSADSLLAMCSHEGTLPIDVLVAVCEKAGAADAFDELRA
jgi:putative tRNA adenosine deaminase-associated protein